MLCSVQTDDSTTAGPKYAVLAALRTFRQQVGKHRQGNFVWRFTADIQTDGRMQALQLCAADAQPG